LSDSVSDYTCCTTFQIVPRHELVKHPPVSEDSPCLTHTIQPPNCLANMNDIEKRASNDADQHELAQSKEGQHVFIRPSAQEEEAVIKKLDWRLLPLVFVLYSLAVLDRSNLGNARLAGMGMSF
jgi:hypothetical protein